jgi:tryptophan synthase alpha chain
MPLTFFQIIHPLPIINLNRIQQLFKQKPSGILSVFMTAGFPQLNDTQTIIEQLQSCGVDMVEVGMPFSDPLADGLTIQQSSQQALQNGMNIDLLFEQLKNIRTSVQIPLLLMGYYNPVLQYGIERFCEQCQAVGIDGLILPDLPLLEYETHCQNIFGRYGLSNIFLVTPQTSIERIHQIDMLSNGFIYAVSSSGITGNTDNFDDTQISYFKKLKTLQLQNPIVVGFGIHNKNTFDTVCQHLNGAIVGSAFIRSIANTPNLTETIKAFVARIKQA